jgi:hypothetical protein
MAQIVAVTQKVGSPHQEVPHVKGDIHIRESALDEPLNVAAIIDHGLLRIGHTHLIAPVLVPFQQLLDLNPSLCLTESLSRHG